MKEFVYYNSLFDVYGCLLTDNEQQSFMDYYQEDMSLSEIADEKNISRSAVQKTLKKVIDKLSFYESKLHVFEKNKLLVSVLDSDISDELKNKINEVLGE